MVETTFNYKAIKIPKPTYDAVRMAQTELMKHGTANIPREIAETCPFCQTELNMIKMSYAYAECPKCHYQQQQVDVNGRGTFALGVVIGLGVAALIATLNKTKKKTK